MTVGSKGDTQAFTVWMGAPDVCGAKIMWTCKTMVNPLKNSFVCLATAVLLFMSLGVQRARAQNFVCCVKYQTMTATCGSPGCTGQITFIICIGGQQGTSGTCGQQTNVGCCTSTYTTTAEGSTICQIGGVRCTGLAPASASALRARPMYLYSSCSGRYVLVRLNNPS